MKRVDFLKEQHKSMFEKKRNEHGELARKLYQQYITNTSCEDNWVLFSGFYEYFSEKFPAEIYEQERIVGTDWHWSWQLSVRDVVTPRNSGHFLPDCQGFLKKGIRGKMSEASKEQESHSMQTSLRAFSAYIKGYAEAAKTSAESAGAEDKKRLLEIAKDCEYISEKPPKSFRQALQLLRFIECFLDMEAGNSAIALGRVDLYLYPFYQQDIAEGVLTPEEAKELILCFYIKISEGHEACMLTLGGNIYNDLTSFFLEAQTYLNMRQPSISLRVSEDTPEEILSKARDLAMVGNGMPAFFNDDVVIKGLKMLGYDEAQSSDYGIVGCYEATPPGVFADTVAGCVNLYDYFYEFLEKETEYPSFEAFLSAYKTYFEAEFQTNLIPRFRRDAEREISYVCPFASCLLNKDQYLHGIDLLGIGILIDSLYTIKKLVFDQKETTIAYLKEQAEKDFADVTLYKKIKNLKEHYGSNSPESNQLAKEISAFIGMMFRKYPIGEHIIASPALFQFAADIWQKEYRGTINGRKKGELLSYGAMPCATPQKDHFSTILLSCANLSFEYFPNGCPVMIGISKKELMQEGILSALLKTFFTSGGFHLALNTLNASLLKKAQETPEQYGDIVVKISGYSTQFTTLHNTIQDAVIERAEHGDC